MARLDLGQRIELEMGRGEEEEVARYASRVEQANGRTLDVAMPTSRGVPVLVPVGTTLRVWKKQQEALFVAPATVKARIDIPLPMYRLQLDGDWERMQRRNGVRLPVAIWPIEAWLLREEQEPQEVNVFIEDISIGGAMVRWRRGDMLEENEPESTRLKIKFDLGDRQAPLELTCAFHRRLIETRHGVKLYKVGVEFVDIDRRQEDRITRFIFKQQLERKRRGLL